ncbi:MAG TPA: 50S ribosomal protein L5 [Candidatus Paceibacterota bacterium]|nr:50S ribosomal protein L5 [Candidatus Paceibacterota bacterium]
MPTVKEKQNKMFDTLKGEFKYKNKMQAPKVVKVVLSSATGSIKDPKKKELIADRLTKISGQKVSPRAAKKSVASFKIRQGDQIGYQVTLRGPRMFDFLEKLVNVSLPRTRDFRGVKLSALDDLGNFTLGIKEHTIFPETSDEELKDVFGLAVTIVTTSKDKKQTEKFLESLGFVFRKTEANQTK